MAFPDSRSYYHVSILYLNPGDEIKISAPALPYARYFSFQAYSIFDFVSSASLRDVDIIPERGPNVYTNVTAAQRREKQGAYEIYITPHGGQGHRNELRAFPKGKQRGFMVLFFRIYQDRLDQPPLPGIEEDLACFAPGGEYAGETPQEWGWACPPIIAVKRAVAVGEGGGAAAAGGEFKDLHMCRYRRKHGISWNDVAAPEPTRYKNRAPNKPFNFFMPPPIHLSGKFANKDAKYLISLAEGPKTSVSPGGGGRRKRKDKKERNGLLALGMGRRRRSGDQQGREQEEEEEEEEEPELWARVTGKLPRTANSLYEPPFIANVTDYEVRYVSLSSVSRSPPYRAYQTIHDLDIIQHYVAKEGPEWEKDRPFTLWFGPPDLTETELPPIIEQERGKKEEERLEWFLRDLCVCREMYVCYVIPSICTHSLNPTNIHIHTALFMPWGKSFKGEHIPFPGVLYRQILSRSQVMSAMRHHGDLGPRQHTPHTHHKHHHHHHGSHGNHSHGSTHHHASASATATAYCPVEAQKGLLGNHHSGIADIIPSACLREKREEGSSPSSTDQHICCGIEAPDHCYDPQFISSRMKGFYPLIEYFHRKKGRSEFVRIGNEEEKPGHLNMERHATFSLFDGQEL